MKTRLILCSILLLMLLSYNGFCQPSASPQPYGVTYEIFVRSFADSNHDGIGDLNGITGKLNYLADLGVEQIWLTPICPSPSYHKYDVTDYYNIDPEYGTMDDFKRLLAEAHARHISVIVDMVFNHSSSSHPWFREAMKGKGGLHRSYYVWSNNPKQWEKDHDWNWTYASEIDDRRPMKEILKDRKNHKADEEKYFSYFGKNMPDLNYENQHLRDEIMKISRFWVQEIGVDGFRLDAIRHLYRDEERVKNIQWWKSYYAEMRKLRPSFYMVGEAWDIPEGIAPFFTGVPAMFNFSLGAAMVEVVQKEQDNIGSLIKQLNSKNANTVLSASENRIAKMLVRTRKLYAAAQPNYIDATFLTNHDINRVGSSLKGDMAKMKLAASMLLTFPGAPYLYYGEEIGMLGIKPDEHIRECMLWDSAAADAARTTWVSAQFSTEKTVTPVAAQLQNGASLLNHYRTLINLRQNHPVLRYGDIRESDVARDNKYLVAFIRVYQGKTLLIVHNVSRKPQSFQFTAKSGVLYGNPERQPNKRWVIPAQSSVIIE